MPSTVAGVLRSAGLEPQGTVRWGSVVPEARPGVYIVALTNEPQAATPTLAECPLELGAVSELLNLRSQLRVDGKRPTPEALAERVAGFWLPDEVILYIGLAGTSLRKRVGQYYRTPLGARKPHAGGWFLKLLSALDSLTVHFAECDDPNAAESQMIREFCDGVTETTRVGLVDPDHPFPFANLEWPPGVRKRHGITGAKGESHSPTSPRTPKVSPATTVASTRGSRTNSDAINKHIQQQLRIHGLDSVTAVEAARWLDEAGLLKDSPHRPGLPLRNLLRERRILGQRQEPNHRWFVDRQR